MATLLTPVITLAAERLRSKTYMTAILGVTLTVIEVNYNLLRPMIPEPYQIWVIALWPIAMVILREATVEALSEKLKDE